MTTLSSVASGAPVAVVAPAASASASASYPAWNGTVVPYTGAAGKTGISLGAAFIVVIVLL